MVPTWKTKKGKTSEFVDAGDYNRKERERGIGDLEWVDKEGWRKKIDLPSSEKDVKTSRICI